MVIDCETCIARPRACGDCVVTHLLSVSDARGRPNLGVRPREERWGPVSLDDAEVVAVATMAAAGLVPPLRLVASDDTSPRWTSSPDMPDFVTRRDDLPLRAIG